MDTSWIEELQTRNSYLASSSISRKLQATGFEPLCHIYVLFLGSRCFSNRSLFLFDCADYRDCAMLPSLMYFWEFIVFGATIQDTVLFLNHEQCNLKQRKPKHICPLGHAIKEQKHGRLKSNVCWQYINAFLDLYSTTHNSGHRVELPLRQPPPSALPESRKRFWGGWRTLA